MVDEYCYLILAVFGSFKYIRNDRRIVNNIMVISAKVFEFEIKETTNANSVVEYKIDDIL